MRKYGIVAAFVLLGVGKVSAQTLFTFGNDSVSATEFLSAYKKNNTSPTLNAADVKEYLDLYIASRLKIREARERGYDTLPQLTADLQNLRTQILPAYLNDRESINRLVKEAFDRSQKDLHLAHIFIPATSQSDTAAAWAKASEAYSKLQKGEDFAKVAQAYSGDPSVKDNGGDLGYITVFSLPYALENLAYNTPAKKLSPIYRSKGGYHIFRNLGERKAAGRIKAAQILLAYPPNATENDKAQVKKLADSLYNRLIKGDDFGKLASAFSNDMVSAAANGQIPEFGVGQYNPAFETVAFRLAKDGALSKPFSTAHGWHIVKRLGRVPVATSLDDNQAVQALREKVEGNDRIHSIQDALAQKVIAAVGLKELGVNSFALFAFTDSALDRKAPPAPLTLTEESNLLHVGNKDIKASEWITFAKVNRYKTDGSGLKPLSQVWDEFVKYAALNYYQVNLEYFNPEFKAQIDEFRDGNLFFEIMQQQIWGPAQTDTAALEKYYQEHKSNYMWKESADAVVFYANDEASAKTFIAQLKKAPANWKELTETMNDKIAADANRFELSQLPNPTKLPLKGGTITAPLVNTADNTTSFAYVIKVYTTPEQRSFNDAKGMVINDYQAELEKQWLAELKAKYPVKVNEQVLNDILSKK
ncbi:MAG TPA: peptidylprolyl isomerase [Chitinophagaceae bacterium]